MHLLLAALFTSTLSLSAVPMPKPGESVCLRREYAADHMRKNPKQRLGVLYVWLRKARVGDENDYSGAKVLGEGRDGQAFLNRDPSCEFKADGKVYCFVECDGGSFTLEPRSDSMNFRVTRDYYFPLFKNGADPEQPREEEILHLNGDDKDNNLYRLFPAENRACEEAFSRVVEKSYGC